MRDSLVVNFSRAAGLSGETPKTMYPSDFKEARLSRKSQASLVHPGVDALG